MFALFVCLHTVHIVCGLFFILVNLNIQELFKLLPQEYSGGKWVVLMISGAKLYKMYLGINGEIIMNSKYYKMLLPLAIGMALSVILLNDWLIDLYSTDGAAIATLVVVLFFSTIKLWYVKRKFSITPYSKKTSQLIVLILLVFVSFYFWNFQFHPIVNIILKTVLISVIYLFTVIKLEISLDINKLLSRLIKL